MKGRGLQCWGALSKPKHRYGKAEIWLQAGKTDVTVRVVRRWRGTWSGVVPRRKSGMGEADKGGMGLFRVALRWTWGTEELSGSLAWCINSGLCGGLGLCRRDLLPRRWTCSLAHGGQQRRGREWDWAWSCRG